MDLIEHPTLDMDEFDSTAVGEIDSILDWSLKKDHLRFAKAMAACNFQVVLPIARAPQYPS